MEENSVPLQGILPTCYETLWEAVSSVDGATLWTRYLKTNGLNTIMEDEEYRGDIFVVQDAGLTECNVTDVFEWPQAACGQEILDLADILSSDDGAPLLMYSWLPRQTVSSVQVDAEGYPTLLSDATTMTNVTRMRFVDKNTVSLLQGIPAEKGRLGGFTNATIVDEVYVCDENKGHVYVLDRPLYPKGLPRVNSTSLPPLQEYCDDTIYNVVDNVAGMQLAAKLALGAYALPIMFPLTNPMTNMTLFTAKFDIQNLNLEEQGIGQEDDTDYKDAIVLYMFSSIVQGGYCPSDFGQDGLVLNTLAGTLTNNTYEIIVKQDVRDENIVTVELLFGDNTAAKYRAEYVGSACYSEVYRLDKVIVPWVNSTSPGYIDGIPFELLDNLPQVASQKDLFSINDSCGEPALSTSSSSSTLSAGAIVGIVLGSCVFVGVCVMVWILCRRKSQRYKAEHPRTVKPISSSKGTGWGKEEQEDFSEEKDKDTDMDTDPYSSDGLILNQSEVVIDRNPINGEKIFLGRGKFGTVYRGTLLGSEHVAVKCVREGEAGDKSTKKRSVDGVSSFEKMAHGEVMKEVRLLKSCRSKYIVSFMGVVFLDDEVQLVTELMPSGDLWNALREKDSTCLQKITWYDGGIFIAMDVAAGLIYLHTKKRVIHMDLKSSNILLEKRQRMSSTGSEYSGSYHAKISDVGLSRFLPVSREYLSDGSQGGTWNWCAPEVILNLKCGSSADMYSYGVVLWEICTGETPVRGCMREVKVPQECPQEIADLISACLTPPMSENKRPRAEEALATLQSVLEKSIPSGSTSLESSQESIY
jgi:serine/threonine-protein kinase RIO1